MSSRIAQLWSISGAAVELGRDRRTISRLISDHRIRAAGSGRSGPTYRLSDLVDAIEKEAGGSEEREGFEAARARKTILEADLLAIEKAQAEGELLPRDEVAKAWAAIVVGVRSKILHSQQIPTAEKDAILAELTALETSYVDHDDRSTGGDSPAHS